MKRFLVFVAFAVLLPTLASASCVWSQSPTLVEGKMVCSSANESAPTLVTQGWQFNTCSKGVTIFVCADSGATITGTGNVVGYVWNPVALLWGVDSGMTTAVTAGAGARCMSLGGFFTAVPGGRIAVVPVSVAVSSGGFTAWMSCN